MAIDDIGGSAGSIPAGGGRGRAVLHTALALNWTDFEDAVSAAAAKRAKCDALVTRNPTDFKGSPVPVLTPSEAVAWLAPK